MPRGRVRSKAPRPAHPGNPPSSGRQRHGSGGRSWGLESSILLEKAPHLAAISLGCDILDAHSVHERVRLNSIPRLAELLQALLEELGQEKEVQA